MAATNLNAAVDALCAEISRMIQPQAAQLGYRGARLERHAAAYDITRGVEVYVLVETRGGKHYYAQFSLDDRLAVYDKRGFVEAFVRQAEYTLRALHADILDGKLLPSEQSPAAPNVSRWQEVAKHVATGDRRNALRMVEDALAELLDAASKAGEVEEPGKGLASWKLVDSRPALRTFTTQQIAEEHMRRTGWVPTVEDEYPRADFGNPAYLAALRAMGV